MELVMLTPTTDGRPLKLSLFLERVPCGFPSPVQDFVELKVK